MPTSAGKTGSWWLSQALFSDPKSVTWLSGFAPPIQLGPHLFAGGPSLIWYEDGHFTLFVVDAFTAGTANFNQQPNCVTVTHQGYTFEQPLAGAGNLIEAIRKTLTTLCHAGGKVGLEARSVPAAISAALSESLPAGTNWLSIDDLLTPLRRSRRMRN